MIDRRSFIIGIKKYSLSKKEKLFLKKYKPWGVILFLRNVQSIKQLKKLTTSIKLLFNDKNYPILIDEEGGRVSRLCKFIETLTFSGEFFGKLYSKNKDKNNFNIFYKKYIKQISDLLKSIGVNVNTLPVLDVRRKNSSSIIGDRSFHANNKIVSEIGELCINRFHENNIGTIMKHIPGHGLAKVDSHRYTPLVKDKLKKLNKIDFYPFRDKKSLIAMTAHIIYRDIDKNYTATHSKKMINLIRNNIGFKNLIITDDISMKALKYSIKENTIKSFEAGCNIVLHCNAKYEEMVIVAKNSPKINKFIIKKTSQLYKIIS